MIISSRMASLLSGILSMLALISTTVAVQPTSLGVVTAIQWSPDNTRLAIGYNTGTVEVQNMIDGNSQFIEYAEVPVSSLAWNPANPDLLAVGFRSFIFHLYDVNSGLLLQSTLVEADEISAVAWNWNGTMLATAYYYSHQLRLHVTPFLVNIWTADGVSLIRSLEAHQNSVTSVSWSNLPGDNRLLSGSDDATVILWDGDTGTEITRWQVDEPVSQVVWAPHEPKSAVLAGSQMQFWDLSTNPPVLLPEATYEGSDKIKSMAWRSDGLALAFVEGFDVKIYQLWPAIPYVSNYTGRTDPAIAWGANNDDLAFGMSPGTLKIIDAPYEDDPDLKPTPTGSYEPPTETPTPLGTPPPTLTPFPVPIPDAGPDRTIETYRDTANVAFDSSGTVDPAGVIESYTWYVDDVFVAVGQTATILMTTGVHSVALVVIFEYDNGVQTYVSDTATITIVKVPTDN